MKIRVLSGGAANGLVSACAGALEAETGHGVDGDFGAVGARRDRIMRGEPVDLVILSRPLIDELAEAGKVDGATVADLGRVATGIAVPEGAPSPDVSTPQALRDALLQADGVFTGDPEKATAAIHFRATMEKLGILETIAPRFHTYQGGQDAMAAMVKSGLSNPIGCTQITEIRNVEGVAYVGDLPPPHDLTTMYTAAVGSGSSKADVALRLIGLMTAREAAVLRLAKGFSA